MAFCHGLAYGDIMSDVTSIVLFDGTCNLCHRAVVFILRRDRNGLFRFASLQSDAGRAALPAGSEFKADGDSILLVEDGVVYDRSTAALRIARRLHGIWPLLYILILAPRAWRDAVYRWIARNRYRWFGRRDSCLLPTPELKDRFLV